MRYLLATCVIICLAALTGLGAVAYKEPDPYGDKAIRRDLAWHDTFRFYESRNRDIERQLANLAIDDAVAKKVSTLLRQTFVNGLHLSARGPGDGTDPQLRGMFDTYIASQCELEKIARDYGADIASSSVRLDVILVGYNKLVLRSMSIVEKWQSERLLFPRCNEIPARPPGSSFCMFMRVAAAAGAPVRSHERD
jgi:hypothetical protein